MKKENKIWTVTEEYVYEGTNEVNVTLFRKRKDAANHMDSIKESWIKSNPEWETEVQQKQKYGPVYFEAWKNSYYSQYHVIVSMEQLPVK